MLKLLVSKFAITLILTTIWLASESLSYGQSIAINPLIQKPSDMRPLQIRGFLRAAELVILEDERFSLVNVDQNPEFTLRGEISDDGTRYEYTLAMLQSGRVIVSRSARISKEYPSDKMGAWLCQQLINHQPYEDRYQLGSLVSTGTQPPPVPQNVREQWYFSFGPAMGEGLNTEQGLSHFNLGRSWEMDLHQIRAFLTSTSGMNQERRTSLSGIGVSYAKLMQSTANTPFISADLVYGRTAYQWVETNFIGEDRFDHHLRGQQDGFIYGIGAGMQFFRNSPVTLEAALQANAFMGRIETGVPSTLGLRLGIYWQ